MPPTPRTIGAANGFFLSIGMATLVIIDPTVPGNIVINVPAVIQGCSFIAFHVSSAKPGPCSSINSQIFPPINVMESQSIPPTFLINPFPWSGSSFISCVPRMVMPIVFTNPGIKSSMDPRKPKLSPNPPFFLWFANSRSLFILLRGSRKSAIFCRSVFFSSSFSS